MDSALTATAIGVGGTVIVGVAGFWANVRNTNKTTALTLQGQVTDRYTRAIEQLGSKEIDVRVGGIYALERIARDSARDQPTIMEVLAAFIRQHSREQWPLPTVHEVGADTPLRLTRADVQAAATVIGRRASVPEDQRINLAGANLTRADLILARLTGAYLTYADLTGASLMSASLIGADLMRAKLKAARLDSADLMSANLNGADLTYTVLTGADLTNADLTGADLTNADLNDADLAGADLTGALWPLSAVVPEGWQKDTDSGRLKRSEPNSGDPTTE